MTHLYFTGFDCLGCRAAYAPDQDLLLCPRCHQLLEARYDLARFGREVDRDAIARRPAGVWRWRELLPVLDPARIVTLGEGGTPFLRSERIARACGVRELWLKSDAANPTGSLKDRSITVSATKAMEFGYDVLACDSTGNKASSTAAYAARAGLRSVVFCPRDTPQPEDGAGRLLRRPAHPRGRPLLADQRDVPEADRQRAREVVRLRHRQPVPLRGQEDLRLRDRPGPGLAGARPGATPVRRGHVAREDVEGLQRAAHARLDRPGPQDDRGAGRPLRAHRGVVEEGSSARGAGGEAAHHRQRGGRGGSRAAGRPDPRGGPRLRRRRGSRWRRPRSSRRCGGSPGRAS